MGLIGPWGATINTLAAAQKDIKAAANMALLQEGEFFRTKIIRGLDDQAPGGKAFKPLSPMTLALRKFLGFKGTKALLRNAYLRNSIMVIKVSDGVVFCGVLRTAKAKDGESLVDVAKMNEEGSKPIVIKLTPKMAAMLAYVARDFGIARAPSSKASTGIIVVQIPARPFMMPVFEQFGEPGLASRRFGERFKRIMQNINPMWQGASGSGLK